MTDSPPLVGAVELGGTKVAWAVGTGPDDLRVLDRITTSDPVTTLASVARGLAAAAEQHGSLAAVGIGAFGPIEVRRGEPGWGRLLATPKPGWSGIDVVGPLRGATAGPIGLETDVVAAALAEERWGAAQGVRTVVYLTVGTGIGGGVIADGEPTPGLPHAEMGHVSVRRQPDDDFPGICAYHGDCLEGLASGPAIAARWGRPGESLGGETLAAAVDLEARYLADGLRTIVYTIAPERIVLGGGAGRMPGLLPRIRAALRDGLAGYPGLAAHEDGRFVSAAGLGDRAGVLGGLIVAERALLGARAWPAVARPGR
jgi:fructokinase